MKLTGFESSKINSDMVNHPSHYNLPDRKECIDEMIDIYGLTNLRMWQNGVRLLHTSINIVPDIKAL